MSDDRLNVLLIEDHADYAKLIGRQLATSRDPAMDVQWCNRLSDGVEQLKQRRFDAVLLDLGLPDSSFGDTLPMLRQHASDIPVIVLTAEEDLETAVESVKQGAQDHLLKMHLSPDLLVRSIRYSVERQQAQRERERLNAELEQRVQERTALLRLLHDIASQANEATSIDEAMQAALSRICQYNDWCFGHAFLVKDQSPRQLVPLTTYYSSDQKRFEWFRRATLKMPLAAGEGLPGRVLEMGRPEWITNVADDLESRRILAKEDLNVGAAVAFPVATQDEIVAVIEFFSDDAHRPDDRTHEAIESIGTQLALAVRRRLAEAALAESELRFRGIFKNAAVGMNITNADGRARIQRVNPALEQMLGYSQQELCGMKISDITHPDDSKRDQELYRDLISGKKSNYEVEKRYVHKDGQILWGQTAVSLVRDPGGAPTYTIAVVADITSRKHAERAVRKLQKEVADLPLNERRRISNQLHEGLGQELTGLSFLTKSLLNDPVLCDSPQYIHIQQLSDTIQGMIGRIKSISRGLAPVEVDKEGLMSALTELARATQRWSDVPCWFVCDRPVRFEDNQIAHHIYRIVQEAVDNAVKHGQSTKIVIQLETIEGQTMVRVTNDGTPFIRPSATSNGQGLQIMQYRANLIGAGLEITAGEEGIGTVVTCVLDRER